MASGKAFGYKGDPDTCLWCGVSLRYERLAATPDQASDPTYQPGDDWSMATVRAPKPGRYQDGFFCGLRCGFDFAVRLAEAGRRLVASGR